eukprot:1229158-Amphidinium_carterae.1
MLAALCGQALCHSGLSSQCVRSLPARPSLGRVASKAMMRGQTLFFALPCPGSNSPRWTKQSNQALGAPRLVSTKPSQYSQILVVGLRRNRNSS